MNNQIEINKNCHRRDCRFLRRKYLKYQLKVYIPLFIRWRQERGLSVDDVAKAVGIPTVVLQRIEGEQMNFRVSAFLRLCAFYHKAVVLQLVDR